MTEEDARKPIQKILAVMDSSPSGERTVQYARALSLRLHCELEVVFVVDTANLDSLLQQHFFVAEERDLFQKQMDENGRQILRRFKEQCKEEDGLAVGAWLLHGRTHQVVLQAMRELKADMLVMGGGRVTSASRKDSGVVEWRLILEQAECPVLVIP